MQHDATGDIQPDSRSVTDFTVACSKHTDHTDRWSVVIWQRGRRGGGGGD
jgi:hypothetical protein